MGRYLIRRFLVSIMTLVAISVVIFSILALAPGDPLSGFANDPRVPAEVRQQLAEQLGINDPVHEQYARWATEYVNGNWGISYLSKSSVSEVILKERLPVTLRISGIAFILSILIAVPIGVLSAIKQYSIFDQVATTVAFIGFSVPTFFSGLVLIYLFSVKLGWLPYIYDASKKGFWPQIEQSLMPIMVLSLFGAATLMRFVRASMLEIINQDYVRTARAKGLEERDVTVRHAMRNALIPVVTIIALSVPGVFGGAVITEQIFRVPGVGSYLIQSIAGADTPAVMAVSFGISILVVLFNVIADILYAVLDPRVKYS